MAVKGLILAGGFATRLRPLSCSKPKLLFPVVGVPLIDRMLAWLKAGGARETILAVNHLSDRLRLEVGERRLGMSIRLSVETEPLGTAGPIRLAEEFLDKDEPFVVANGDIVSDIDLKAALETQTGDSAIATIALVSVSDPSQYGSVTLDSKGRISAFEEKKKRGRHGGLVNAGVYVLTPRILDYIPSRGPASLERDVFPKLARKALLSGRKHDGYWYDIGRIPSYVKANMELLKSAKELRNGSRYESVRDRRHPFHLGNGTRLGRGAVIGPNAIFSERVRVGEGSTVKDSIIFEDTVIGKNCSVLGALIGERVAVGNDSRIRRGAVIAGQISIPEGSNVRQNEVVLT